MKPEKVPADLLRYPADDYLCIDFGEGEDYEYGYRRMQFVRTQKPRKCLMGGAEHAAGTVMVQEAALVDGKPGTCHCCLACAGRYLDFDARVEDADEEIINPHDYHCDGTRRQEPK